MGAVVIMFIPIVIPESCKKAVDAEEVSKSVTDFSRMAMIDSPVSSRRSIVSP